MSSKNNLGIFAIATLTLMVTTSIFGAVNNAEAQSQDTTNRIISAAHGGNLLNIASPQIGVDVIAQVGIGKSNTASSTQSNEANTANKQCVICIEPFQYNLGLTAQVSTDDSNTVEREQSNKATVGDRTNALYVYGPNQNNKDLTIQIGGGLNTYLITQSNTVCTIACQ